MRIEQKEVKIYGLEDLKKEENEAIKENVVKKFIENGMDFDFMAEDYINEKKIELEKLGYNGVKIMYSGFWSQGDGACFTCDSISFLTVYDRLDFKVKKESLKNLYSDNFSGYIKHVGRYYHENSIELSIDFSYSNCSRIDTELENIHNKVYNFLNDEIKDISRKIYRELEEIYYCSISEEYIFENIEANNYEFLEDGSMY